MKCSKCEGYKERLKVKTPYEYYNLVEQLKGLLSKGTFKLIEGNCNFDNIKSNLPFPNDYIFHIFECTQCSCKFQLEVETYHGSGGKWDMY